ncbi:hypothetical protein SAMN03159353_103821 [Cedecea sp. NFIX57]|nr:hypothetical protein SAMN03159353_103821 [Cedecea sp. NFIX57]
MRSQEFLNSDHYLSIMLKVIFFSFAPQPECPFCAIFFQYQ